MMRCETGDMRQDTWDRRCETRAGNSLIPSLLIHSFAHFAQIKWATVSDSLRSLKTNERLWANRSGCSEEMSDREQFAQVAQRKWAMWVNRSFRSPKMSDHERFAQVAQRKWAIVSESLRSLTKNERMNESLIFLSESLICSFLDKKRSIRSEIKWANSQPCVRQNM